MNEFLKVDGEVDGALIKAVAAGVDKTIVDAVPFVAGEMYASIEALLQAALDEGVDIDHITFRIRAHPRTAAQK